MEGISCSHYSSRCLDFAVFDRSTESTAVSSPIYIPFRELPSLLSIHGCTLSSSYSNPAGGLQVRADDNGEGGTFALYSLLCRHAKVGLLPNHQVADDELLNYEMCSFSKAKVDSRARRAIEKHKSTHYLMLFLALLGSCMVIANGVLIPSISVFSASRGLEQSLVNISDTVSSRHHFSKHHEDKVNGDLNKYVPVPSACAILVGLFALQHYGTHKIGFMFAPIVVLWLLFNGGIGLYNIFHWNSHIIHAISPEYMYRFIRNLDMGSWRSLGGVLLCIAGSEAMFADLGHFSKKSIQIAFGLLVYPSLIITYMGQTAFISKNLRILESQDFHASLSIPGPARHTHTVLSLFASVVGSQATITGTFSIINQCLALGCFPRVKVVHTSEKIHGQVYIPDVNWILMVLCLGIIVGFGDLRPIASATGLAIITGMLITTCLMSLVITLYWESNIFLSACFLIFFGSIEVIYLSACMLNFHKGAWFLIIFVVVLMITMLSWHYGTMKKYDFDVHNRVSLDWLTELGPNLGVSRVPGIGFIYTDVLRGIPAFFSHFVTNLPAYHRVLIFVSFKSVPVPYVSQDRRYLIGRFGPKEYRVYRCIVRYGYRDSIRESDFEDKLIMRIGEFVSVEDTDPEALTSPEGRMIVIGNMDQGGNALILHNDASLTVRSMSSMHGECLTTQTSPPSQVPLPMGRRKKVRFQLPPESPEMSQSIREELQELVDARESGSAYFLGRSHLHARNGSNILKTLMISVYIFLDKNCREHSVALNIPYAALVEVGMVCSI
ncbi:potassium transporter 25-like isoform X3 [Magnolia sinica]|uniref:potassium transporter 25-like isoform X3 n=1 Tax=Magnolia sinica TaxID=86752 RepID=UPI00265904AC|nr:potassium transporter 25-like isoform X3 [Magnolia sinica]